MDSTIRELYLNGDSGKAAELRNEQFCNMFPIISNEISQEIHNLLIKSRFQILLNELEQLKTSLPFNLESESRIKSVASIHDSLDIGHCEELNVDQVKDLVGYRYWIECENFGDYPRKMMTLVSSLLTSTKFLPELDCIRMIDMDDNPHQKTTFLFRIDKVYVEVQIKNLLFKSSLSRTIYPMWESHIKNRLSKQSIPFFFDKNQREKLWNIVCIAKSDQSIHFPFNFDQCHCPNECEMRAEANNIDAHFIHQSMGKIANHYGKKLIIV